VSVFVDTSALYALLDRADPAHERARAGLLKLRDSDSDLVTHRYVEVESIALVQRRLGRKALAVLLDDVFGVIEIRTVGNDLHAEAIAALRAGPTSVSFVDQVSFTLMRRERIASAFAFDGDFPKQGFNLVA
jgi:predicted nucleic acid-binding protein